MSLRFVAGVIPREKMAMFERMLWRVSRGNAFLRQEEIAEELKDPTTVGARNIYCRLSFAMHTNNNIYVRNVA